MAIYRLVGFALLAFSLAAQTTTRITGTPKVATDDPVSGSVTITPVFPASSSTPERVMATGVTVQFTSGKLSVPVIPTDALTPSGQKYRVTYTIPAGQVVNGHSISPITNYGPCYWTVPTSATPLDVGAVESCASTVIAPVQVAGGDLTGNYPSPTLVTANNTPGACGDATHACQITTDAKGRVTSQQSALQPAGGDLSGYFPNPTVKPIDITKLTSAAADGTYCIVVAGGKITGLTACSSGGGALSWASLTSAQWAALTSSQWAALTN